MRTRRVLAAAVGVLLLAVPASTFAVTTTAPANVLRAGHRLNVGESLKNGEFTLLVEHDMLEILQGVLLSGPAGQDSMMTGTWFRDDGTGAHQSDTDRSTLGLRANGNLVLATAGGTVLWSSHTAGTGSDNRLVLRANGNLVLLTAANRQVWSSRSGAVLLPAGRTLGSGHRMVDAYGSEHPHAVAETLAMQTDGNLVRRCGRRILWQTHTHVRGSVLRLRKDGGLVVVTPHGRTVWSAHTGGHGPYTYFDMRDVSVNRVDLADSVIWRAHLPYVPGC